MRELIVLLLVVVLIYGWRRLRSIGDDLSRATGHKEFSRMPVYSAETTHHKEAEFVADRLPRKSPKLFWAVVVAVVCSVVWKLTQ
jgi:Sec-independent protein translocase protein TatA